MRHVLAAAVLCLSIAAGGHATTFAVTNTNDSGPGSLRQAIMDANAAHPATVAFSIGSGVQTIMPLSTLPAVAQGVTVDGTTQPGYAGSPLIEVNNSLIPISWFDNCLALAGEIRALAINRCSGRAIYLSSGRITACFIGTDVTGHTAQPNNTGIFASGSSVQPSEIGGNNAGDGNLISGNLRDITVAGQGTVIAHNRIGTDVSGETALGFNGSAAISVEYTSDVSIQDNVIGAHSMGIECFYSNGTIINNNYIGVSASGHPLPNATGIHVYQSNFAQIGTGGGNVIAYNTTGGIEMDGASIRNTVRGNSIHHNGQIGIDLSLSYTFDGVTANDPGDGDAGPNVLQNFPILTNVTSIGGQTVVTGTINSTPNQAITLDFYANNACSGSGYGEGEFSFGSGSVQTDANGNGIFAFTFAASFPAGVFVTATATDPYGNTSEFSACRVVQGAGTFVFSSASVSVGEGAGNATVTVNRTNGTAGAAAVSYSTANGTATAGSDYTLTAGTLTFADGEVSKTFSVPITNDAVFEGNEQFTVTLSGATNGATVGNPQTVTVTILENDPAPSISIADAQKIEGNSGTANMTFTVTLTGATTVPATVQYNTQSSSASSGSDFQFVSGTLTFGVGETQKTINVPIFGDTAGESDESFYVFLFSPSNATLSRSLAVGTIINDDVVPAVSTAPNISIVEGNSGTTNAAITLTASQPFYGEIYFYTVDGTARAPGDYGAASGYVFFNFETSKTILIPIVGDTQPEPDETFTVQLFLFNYSSPQFTLPTSAVTIKINTDDSGIGPAQLNIPRGGTGQLSANFGTPAPQSITLSSSNPAVATVPSSVQIIGGGQIDVTAHDVGSATITVTTPAAFGGITTQIGVNVYDPENLILSPATLKVPVGGKATISASFKPALAITEGVALKVNGNGAITFPDRIFIDAGQTTAFTITGVTRGIVLLTGIVEPGNTPTTITIEVTDPPTTPSITQLSPANGPAAGGTSITLNGANLRRECTVTFGGVPAADVAFVSASSLTATTPEHAPGAVDVALFCGVDTFTLPAGFTYLAASPTLSNVSPSFGTTAGNTLVRITGANIASGCWPFFDGIPARAVTVNGPTDMVASTPAHASPATVPLTLRCSGVADVSLANAFTYTSAAESAPVITGVDPLVGSAGKVVTISGARFRYDDTVTFDAAGVAILYTSPGIHVVRIPELPLGKTSITVTEPGGRNSTTGPIFTIVEPQPPQIVTITPTTTRPANEITLDGSGFRPGYSFTIGDQPATLVSMTYTRVVLRVPQIAAGSYNVDVLNAAAKIAAVGPQVNVLAPGLAIARVAPNCVTTEGGARLSIKGTGFASGAVVTFDGAVAAGAIVTDEQTITLTLPPLPAGMPRVVVTNPNGEFASLTSAFSVISPFDPNGCSARARPARH